MLRPPRCQIWVGLDPEPSYHISWAPSLLLFSRTPSPLHFPPAPKRHPGLREDSEGETKDQGH